MLTKKKEKKKANLLGGRGKQSKEERNKWHVWRQWVYAVVPCFAYRAGCESPTIFATFLTFEPGYKKEPPKKGALKCQPQARKPEAKPHVHCT